MKKVVGVALVCGLAGGGAYAQSSVTLYGIIDEGLAFNSNAGGGRQYSMSSGVIQGNRWGLRGREELGAGLAAVFQLENGFDPSTGKLGQGGLGFGRTALVGLSSPYGLVTVGRQYDSVVDYLGPLEVGDQWGGYYAAHPADIDNFNNTFRVNNAIKYTSPTISGVTFGGVYSLGGVAGDVTRNQLWSLGVGYVNGPVTLGAAYLNSRNPNVGFFGNSTSGTPSAANAAQPSPVSSGFASARTYQSVGAGGAYTFGAATFGATYSNVKFSALGDLSSGPNPHGYSGTATFNNAEVSVKYQFTPALVAGIAYDYTRGTGTSNSAYGATYHQGAMGADYFLSKRTDLSVVLVYQTASGIDSTGAPARANINETTPSSNGRQFLARIGIRHRF
jgi:predicted porin